MNKTKNPKQVQIGIVGLGMAGSIMIPVIEAHPEVVLAGAAEPSEEFRHRFAKDFECPVTETLEELVRLPELDAVYIATPHQMHCDHVLMAARHGKHVIVEKPMALKAEDCEEMIRACEEAAVAIVVGHTHGFGAPVAAIREMVASGRFGALRMLQSFNYTNFLYRPRRPEELDSNLGGGILFNQVPHQIEIIRTIAGGDKVTSVTAVTGKYDTDRNTEGAVMAMLDLSGGASATIVYSGYDHFDSDEFHGWIGEGGNTKEPAQGQTRAQLAQMREQSDEADMRNQLFGYGSKLWPQIQAMARATDHPHFGTLIVSCEGGDLRSAPGGIAIYSDSGPEFEELPQVRAGGGRAEVLDELCDAVLRGKQPFHDGYFGRDTLEVCLGIQRAAQSGKQISLDAKFGANRQTGRLAHV